MLIFYMTRRLELTSWNGQTDAQLIHLFVIVVVLVVVVTTTIRRVPESLNARNEHVKRE